MSKETVDLAGPSCAHPISRVNSDLDLNYHGSIPNSSRSLQSKFLVKIENLRKGTSYGMIRDELSLVVFEIFLDLLVSFYKGDNFNGYQSVSAEIGERPNKDSPVRPFLTQQKFHVRIGCVPSLSAPNIQST
ncbi:hypothetical protein HPP92_019008 [Vanilla planifolia]|uniref:Uncharacterized protein n=1 Tax=Vanilla planifolia TaxID=51239 RepID=A0A835Q9V3_VANPL|nr:hypothetical protein HPP92_019008 [Vanilla planifolia]